MQTLGQQVPTLQDQRRLTGRPTVGPKFLWTSGPWRTVNKVDSWVAWARRCRIESFVVLQRRIVGHRAQILASIAHGLSNGLIESVNTKIRLITRIAFGFANPDPLIALAMLTLGGHRPALPGRQ